MLGFTRLPLTNLIELCRVLRHSLGAGIMLRDVFRQQARKGALPVRPVAERISEALERGDSLEAALEHEKHVFPPLFLSLAAVGENTGNMPEIFGELEKYYIMQQRFWRKFWAASLLPIIQLIAAIFIIAGLIFVLGFIGSMNNQQPIAPIGFGLRGTSGALKFLFSSFGTIGLLIVGYMVLSRSLEHKALVDGALLHLPAVGPFLMALNLSRFSLALHLTLETGMAIAKALALSLRATGNAAFAAKTRMVQDALRSGEDLTLALTQTRLFPEEFLHILAVGEEGGRVPEVMRQMADQYEEEAERRLAVLTKMAGFGVWLVIACLIIFAIFRLYGTYFSYLDQASRQ